MTHLCKRWVYFPNLHLQMSLFLFLSRSLHLPRLFLSADIQQAIRTVCLEGPAFNKSDTGMHFRSCFCSRVVNCRTAFHLSGKAPPLTLDWQELQPLRARATEPVQTHAGRSQLQQKQNGQGWSNGKCRWDLF